ncbi:MAG: hypothetical protein ABIO16_03280 [Nocardioides sp.]
MTGQNGAGQNGPGQNEDAAWAAIIANYGDRPVLDPLPEPKAPEPQPEPDLHPELAAETTWPQERFVPPPPPPLPRLPVDRLLAWSGVFLSPLILLLATILRLHLPTLLAWTLVLGFLGGFGYLVAQMPRGPRDPYDDGARL